MQIDQVRRYIELAKRRRDLDEKWHQGSLAQLENVIADILRIDAEIRASAEKSLRARMKNPRLH